MAVKSPSAQNEVDPTRWRGLMNEWNNEKFAMETDKSPMVHWSIDKLRATYLPLSETNVPSLAGMRGRRRNKQGRGKGGICGGGLRGLYHRTLSRPESVLSHATRYRVPQNYFSQL